VTVFSLHGTRAGQFEQAASTLRWVWPWTELAQIQSFGGGREASRFGVTSCLKSVVSFQLHASQSSG